MFVCFGFVFLFLITFSASALFLPPKQTDHGAALFSQHILGQPWEKRCLVLCSKFHFAFPLQPFAILTNLLSPPQAAYFRYTLEISCLDFSPRSPEKCCSFLESSTTFNN